MVKSILYKIIKNPWRFLFYLNYYISFPIALIFVILIRIISSFYLVRWACIKSSRIGHLTLDTTIYYLYKKNNLEKFPKKHLDIFYMRYDVANKTIASFLKNKFLFFPSSFMHAVDKINNIFEKILPTEDIHLIGMHKHDKNLLPKVPWLNRDIYGAINNSPSIHNFSEYQENKGREFLASLNINSEDKFVCLYVRDEAYLKKEFRTNDWSYHNFRNHDIDNFYMCADQLTKRGYHVIRMGSVVEKKFDNKGNKMIFDYGSSNCRSDFLDIYLLAKCNLCISTSGGLDNVSLIFKVPVLLIGVLPIGDIQSYYKNVMVTSRTIYSKKLNRNLTLSEIFQLKLGYSYTSDEYNDFTIEVLSSETITNSMLELLKLMNNNFYLEEDDNILQEKFKKKFLLLASLKDNKEIFHKDFHATFDPLYLRNNTNWLE